MVGIGVEKFEIKEGSMASLGIVSGDPSVSAINSMGLKAPENDAAAPQVNGPQIAPKLGL